MNDDAFYFSMPNSVNKDAAINGLLQSLLEAKDKVKIPSLVKGFDDDVNLYIAHLLFAVSIPNYAVITDQYISLHSPEVLVLADMAEDLYLKYFIFKVNADNLLLHIGAYKDLSYKKHHKSKEKNMKSFIDDAVSFYSKAAELNRKIYKRKTAISDVLMKLSKNFNFYIELLSCMRKDFFRFLNRYEDSEFASFLDSMRNYEKKVEFEKKQDIFLDLYSKWLKRKSKSLKMEINHVCDDLRALDPSFDFRLE